jgi:hypothetical protein
MRPVFVETAYFAAATQLFCRKLLTSSVGVVYLVLDWSCSGTVSVGLGAGILPQPFPQHKFCET